MLFFISVLFGGFGPETVVKIPNGHKSIAQLSVGDTVISCNEDGNEIEETVLLATKYCSENVYRCKSAGSDDFYVGSNQLFVDLKTNLLVLPYQLTVNDNCLCEPINNQEAELHEIIISGNHLFYVTTDDICVHNMIQIPLKFIEFVGNQFFLNLPDQYSKLLYAGFILAVEFCNNIPQKIFIIEDTDKEKNFLLSKNNNKVKMQFYGVGALNRVRCCSMNEFLNNTKFGQDIKNKIEPTKKKVQGVRVYRALEDIREYGLNKGDQIYVDRAHCDHLEVFTKRGDAILVLNLDGTKNDSKTVRGMGRKI